MDNPTILIVDSGIGGLSVTQEIQLKLPRSQLIYLADNGAFPYGIQEESTLVERLLHLIPPLEQHHTPDLIVIACNTASTVVLPPLRRVARAPVIGVVPAIKPAAELSKNHKLAVLATPGTISRSYTRQLIQQFASHCEVSLLGSSELVQQAENKLRGLPVDLAVVTKALAPLLLDHCQVDTLVLGCTHFPLLKQEIEHILPRHIQVIDSGEAIARRAVELVRERPERNRPRDVNRFLFSAESHQAHALEAGIKHWGFSHIQFLCKSATEFTQKSGESK